MPVPVPPSLLPEPSTIVSLSLRFRPSVPLPVPVDAVTVRVAPEPVTLVIDGDVRPEFASAKSAASTPVTLSLNVTVQLTLDAFVGLEPARLIETTVGAVASTSVV